MHMLHLEDEEKWGFAMSWGTGGHSKYKCCTCIGKGHVQITLVLKETQQTVWKSTPQWPFLIEHCNEIKFSLEKIQKRFSNSGSKNPLFESMNSWWDQMLSNLNFPRVSFVYCLVVSLGSSKDFCRGNDKSSFWVAALCHSHWTTIWDATCHYLWLIYLWICGPPFW